MNNLRTSFYMKFNSYLSMINGIELSAMQDNQGRSTWSKDGGDFSLYLCPIYRCIKTSGTGVISINIAILVNFNKKLGSLLPFKMMEKRGFQDLVVVQIHH